MFFIWLKLIFAVLILWPRGYLLVYLIDRSKSFSFGFKVAVGWIFGLSAFTLDIFAANVFGGFKLLPWIFLGAAFGQIIGLEIMIFILERKLVYPDFKKFRSFYQKQKESFSLWSKWEKLALAVLVLTLLIRVVVSLEPATRTTTFDLTDQNKESLQTKLIFTNKDIFLEKGYPLYLLGSKSYPLNDRLFKVWLTTAAGNFKNQYFDLAQIFYYLILVAIFYFSLPLKMNRWLRLAGVYLLAILPLVYFHPQVIGRDLLFTSFLFLTFASLFYWLLNRGSSFFYLSGIALAFSVWTKSDGLLFIFPLIFLITIILLLLKKCRLKQLILYWFFAALTISPWLTFIITNRPGVLRSLASSSYLAVNLQLAPLAILFLTFLFNRFFVKINLYGSQKKI
jgi:hypothetical protein